MKRTVHRKTASVGGNSPEMLPLKNGSPPWPGRNTELVSTAASMDERLIASRVSRNFGEEQLFGVHYI